MSQTWLVFVLLHNYHKLKNNLIEGSVGRAHQKKKRITLIG